MSTLQQCHLAQPVKSYKSYKSYKCDAPPLERLYTLRLYTLSHSLGETRSGRFMAYQDLQYQDP